MCSHVSPTVPEYRSICTCNNKTLLVVYYPHSFHSSSMDIYRTSTELLRSAPGQNDREIVQGSKTFRSSSTSFCAQFMAVVPESKNIEVNNGHCPVKFWYTFLVRSTRTIKEFHLIFPCDPIFVLLLF
jgi:hypothetical protein